MTKHAASYMPGKAMAGGTLGLLLATAFGAILGVLFAPKAGTETRHEVAERARQLAWRMKRNRAQIRDNINLIFGELSDELEQSYYQVRNEIMTQMEELEPEEMSRAVTRGIIRSVVNAAARGRDWTRAQIDAFIAHLEDEYNDVNKTAEIEDERW